MKSPGSNTSSRSSISRACTSCATAKAKCVPRAGHENSDCERCDRLNKQCFNPVAVPRKRRSRKTTRVEQLEQKLDGIVTLLTASKSPSASSTPQPVSQEPLLNGQIQPAVSRFSDSLPPSFGLPLGSEDTSNASEGSSRSRLSISEAGGITGFTHSLEDAEALLTLFRTEMAEYFPFVVIPPGTTSQSLHHEKPLLYMSIMVAASYRDWALQMRLGDEIMEFLSSRLLFQGEKTLETLQGLLVYIAWYLFHHDARNPQLTNLLHWAVAMVTDLGLNRDRRVRGKDNHTNMMMMTAARIIEGETETTLHCSSDERRALVGCFYLTSMISVCLKKIDPFPDNPFITECCRALEKAAEYPTDLYLVHLVRLQQAAQKIGRILPYNESGNSWTSDVPIGVYIKSLEGELQTLKENLPKELHARQHTTLLMQYYNIEIYLHEICLHEVTRQPPADHERQPLWRLETLYACLRSVKSFLRNFLVPESTRRFLGFPIAAWAQLTHALIVLSKLSLYDAEGWDVSQVRRELDFSEVLGQVIQELELCTDVFELTGGYDVFSRFAALLRTVKIWYDTKIVSEHGRKPTSSFNPSSEFSTLFRSDDSLDQGFWNSI